MRWYGVGWYHNPGLWGTADGIVPWREFWVWFRAIPAGRAWDRLNQAQGQALVEGEPTKARQAWQADHRDAFGG